MEKLLIIGTGDYAQVAAFYLSKRYDIVGFSEEKSFRVLKDLEGLPIYDFEDISAIFNPSEVKILVAVGPNRTNSVRERLYLEIKEMNYQCITYIDPKAYVWDDNAIGENSFIFPNATVEPFASVGNNCVMWSGASLSHHSVLQDHSFMAPNSAVSGKSIIMKNCFLGINSTIRDNITVKENCIIGAGAIIKKDTVSNGVYSAKETPLYNLDSKNTKV